MKNKHEKSKPTTGLRRLCLIHDNTGAHECKLLQVFLEAETMEQIPNPHYPTDLSPCDFKIVLLTLLKKNISRRRYEPQSPFGSAIYSVYKMCFKKYPYLYSEP